MKEALRMGAILTGILTGFALGMLVSWSAMAAMPPERRDAFLRGATDGMSPAFWWRKWTR